MSGLSRRAAIGLVTAASRPPRRPPTRSCSAVAGGSAASSSRGPPDAIVIETGPGRVTLPMAASAKVVEGRSALEAYQERAAALAPGDAPAGPTLARWAAERGLVTQSREAWQRVLSADPSHAEANAALGRVEVDGAWMGQAEAYRARGYVSFEGRWVTPAEHEALVRERAAEEASAARDARGRAARPGGRGARPRSGGPGAGGRGRGAAGATAASRTGGAGADMARPGLCDPGAIGTRPSAIRTRTRRPRIRPADATLRARPSHRPIGRPHRSRRRAPPGEEGRDRRRQRAAERAARQD